MTSVTDIAAEFVRRAFNSIDPEESDLPTPSRLQKWLFYAQGWSLGLLGKPLFAEPIEAWKNGPVVPELYHRLVDYKMNVVPPEEFAGSKSLEPIQAAIVDLV
jgi:uncharacterized phage-associated protein